MNALPSFKEEVKTVFHIALDAGYAWRPQAKKK